MKKLISLGFFGLVFLGLNVNSFGQTYHLHNSTSVTQSVTLEIVGASCSYLGTWSGTIDPFMSMVIYPIGTGFGGTKAKRADAIAVCPNAHGAYDQVTCGSTLNRSGSASCLDTYNVSIDNTGGSGNPGGVTINVY